MKKYLYTSICCFTVAIIGIILLCQGCTLKPAPEPRTWQSYCFANALLVTCAVGRDHPTRGRTCRIEGEYHIQIEYLPDENGPWIPLQVIRGDHAWPMVKEGVIEGEAEYGNQIFNELEYLIPEHVLMECWSRLKEVPEGRLNK